MATQIATHLPTIILMIYSLVPFIQPNVKIYDGYSAESSSYFGWLFLGKWSQDIWRAIRSISGHGLWACHTFMGSSSPVVHRFKGPEKLREAFRINDC